MRPAVQTPPCATEVGFTPLTPEWLDRLLFIEASAYSHPWTRGNFLDAIGAGYQGLLLVADTELLGYFIAMNGVDEVHLLNITVAPCHQRQGWARLMLDALMLWARGRQAGCAWLEVRASNERARQIYAAYGFEQVGVRRHYYPAHHGEREDAIVMRFAL